VYEFKNGNIKEYLGDIDFYLEQRKAEDFRKIEKGEKKIKTTETKSIKEGDYKLQKKLKSLHNRLSGIERKIGDLEKTIAALDHELLMNYDETAAKPGFFDDYQGKKKNLEKLMEEWEDISMKIDAI
jgi:ATP-binding cassette subfamily F protein 3